MIETEHRGYNIRYAENEDVWRCHTLGMDGDTLTQLKNKINRHVSKMSKVGGLPALVCQYGHGKFEECEIVSVADDGKLWISKPRKEMWRGELRTVKDRSKVDAGSVVLDTLENRGLIAESDRILDEIRKLTEAGKDYFKSIPRVDVSTLPREASDAP